MFELCIALQSDPTVTAGLVFTFITFLLCPTITFRPMGRRVGHKDNVTKQSVLFAYDKLTAREFGIVCFYVKTTGNIRFLYNCSGAYWYMCHVKAVCMVDAPC